MTLRNMRDQGVHHLISYCLHHAFRHQAPIDVSSYADDIEARPF
jgi:hypothetical protein